MPGQKDLQKLIRNMTPRLNDGDYVFVSVSDLDKIDRNITVCEFKEKEGATVVIEKHKADELYLSYEIVVSWITLMVHSSLQAVGLTAIFSTALAQNDISCNVIAGYYHDHIFVDKEDGEKAMGILRELTINYKKGNK